MSPPTSRLATDVSTVKDAAPSGPESALSVASLCMVWNPPPHDQIPLSHSYHYNRSGLAGRHHGAGRIEFQTRSARLQHRPFPGDGSWTRCRHCAAAPGRGTLLTCRGVGGSHGAESCILSDRGSPAGWRYPTIQRCPGWEAKLAGVHACPMTVATSGGQKQHAGRPDQRRLIRQDVAR